MGNYQTISSVCSLFLKTNKRVSILSIFLSFKLQKIKQFIEMHSVCGVCVHTQHVLFFLVVLKESSKPRRTWNEMCLFLYACLFHCIRCQTRSIAQGSSLPQFHFL